MLTTSRLLFLLLLIPGWLRAEGSHALLGVQPLTPGVSNPIRPLDVELYEQKLVSLNLIGDCSGVAVDGCILTAAHCLPMDVRPTGGVLPGEIRQGAKAENGTPRSRRVKRYLRNPRFDLIGDGTHEDLAILRPNLLIGPAESFRVDILANESPSPGEWLHVGGYGFLRARSRFDPATSQWRTAGEGLGERRFGTVEVAPAHSLAARVAPVLGGSGITAVADRIRAYTFSETRNRILSSVLPGDSGGPAFQVRGGKWQLTGINSNIKGAEPGSKEHWLVERTGAVENNFAPISAHREWIRTGLRELGCGNWQQDARENLKQLLAGPHIPVDGSWQKDPAKSEAHAVYLAESAVRNYFSLPATGKVAIRYLNGTSSDGEFLKTLGAFREDGSGELKLFARVSLRKDGQVSVETLP